MLCHLAWLPQELRCECFSFTGLEHHISAAVRLAALAVLEGLSTERTLVDLALWRAREGHTKVLELRTDRSLSGAITRVMHTSSTVLGASRHM